VFKSIAPSQLHAFDRDARLRAIALAASLGLSEGFRSISCRTVSKHFRTP